MMSLSLSYRNIKEDIVLFLVGAQQVLDHDPKKIIAFFTLLKSNSFKIQSNQGLKSLLQLYQELGEPALAKVFRDWKELGIPAESFDGSGRWLHLSEAEKQRLKLFKPEAGYANLFYPHFLLSLSETDVQKWLAFNQDLHQRELNLPLEIRMAIFPSPELLNLIDLLWKKGPLKTLFANQSASFCIDFLEYWKTHDFVYLNEHLDELGKLFDSLETRYQYSFADFSQNSPQGRKPENAIGEIRALLQFQLEEKEAFLSQLSLLPHNSDVLVVTARNKETAHAILDDEPGRFSLHEFGFLKFAATNSSYPSLMEARSKEEFVDDLLEQMVMMPILPRQENKLYLHRESVNKEILSALPLAKLLKLQWALNNVQKQSFRKKTGARLEEDYQKISGEAGGFAAPNYNTDHYRIDSLFSPLALYLVEAADSQQNQEQLDLLDIKIKHAANAEELRELEAQKKALQENVDGHYLMPEKVRDQRFGWDFDVHFHAVKGMQNNLYAGPSGRWLGFGGDLGTTPANGDGIVFTRIDENSFNADYYGCYPVFKNDKLEWESFVIDLGVYRD